jgi:integrase
MAGRRPHRPTTATRVASLISEYIDGTKISSMRLAAVRPPEVQAWVSDRSQGLSPGTLLLLVALLRSVFAAAVQDRLVASSPVARLSLAQSERERIVPLSVAQVPALAQAMPTRSKAMVITDAGLGLRIAELLALRVQDGRVPATNSADRVAAFARREAGGSTHTPRSRRTLALPNVVAEFRYGKDRKSDAKAWQMWQATSTPGSITATSSKTASATLKAGALSPELVSKIHSLPLSFGKPCSRPRRDSNARPTA